MKPGSYARLCHDCGSSSLDTPFPGTHKPYGRIDRCTDCLAEFERLTARLTEASAQQQARAIATRASYRAAYRHRASQAQTDLVDLRHLAKQAPGRPPP